MSDVRRNNLKAIAEKYKSQKELAEAIGLNPAQLNQLIVDRGSDSEGGNKRYRNIGEKLARKIEAKLGLEDLFLDKPCFNKNFYYSSESNSHEIKLGRFTRVPVIGSISFSCNDWGSLVCMNSKQEEGIITYPTRDLSAYAIRCKGDGLRPRIKDGEYLIIEPEMKVNSGDEVLIKNNAGEMLVKEFLYSRDENLYVASINDDKKQAIPMIDVAGFFKIRAIARQGDWYVPA